MLEEIRNANFGVSDELEMELAFRAGELEARNLIKIDSWDDLSAAIGYVVNKYYNEGNNFFECITLAEKVFIDCFDSSRNK